MTEISLSSLAQQWYSILAACQDLESLETSRLQLFGKSGVITLKLRALGQVTAEERKTQGSELNKVKEELSHLIQQKKISLEQQKINQRLSQEALDVTLPVRPYKHGKIHLLTQVMETIQTYFQSLGFQKVEGPEIEDEYYNFDALNIPAHHPARQNHDTFFLKDWPNRLLRTQTSTIQIRTLLNQKPPLRMISMGRVYRSDHLDATHTPMFHQIEGLVIEPNISMAHLKGCLTDFCRVFFNNADLKVRFRPSFFPFTEPSLEVDILYHPIKGEPRWLEVLGAGMVHPTVLKNCNLEAGHHQGFAFGMGIERLLMLKYGLTDIRALYQSDQRWLDHYGQRP